MRGEIEFDAAAGSVGCRAVVFDALVDLARGVELPSPCAPRSRAPGSWLTAG